MKLEDVREIVVLDDTILVNKYLEEGWFVIETAKYGSKRSDLEEYIISETVEYHMAWTRPGDAPHYRIVTRHSGERAYLDPEGIDLKNGSKLVKVKPEDEYPPFPQKESPFDFSVSDVDLPEEEDLEF